MFGLNASPFLLNATIRHHLNRFVLTDPCFVRKMLGFCVDDLVSGANTSKNASELYSKALSQMASRGFRLRKWETNDPTLRQKIHESCKDTQPQPVIGSLEEDETYAKSKLIPQTETKGEKVLGLAWSLESDTIHFNFENIARKKENSEPTKSFLSLLSSLFDPLGLISGIIVSMKILFQDVCKDKLGCDEVFGNDMKNHLDKRIEDLVATREIYVDRCLYDANIGDVSECYLHGFGDTSENAYCAVVYLVYRTEAGEARAKLTARLRLRL